MAKKQTKKKNGVKFGALIGAVVVLLLLIYFCARPVSVGFTYSKSTTTDLPIVGEVTTTTKTHFNTFKKVTSQVIVGEEDPIETEGYYYEKDGQIINLVTDEEGYEDAKELAEKLNSKGVEINAFTYGEGDNAAVCGGAIAMVAVLAVIEVVLAGVAVMSFIKKK